MRYFIYMVLMVLSASMRGQQILRTKSDVLQVKVNGKFRDEWTVMPEIRPDVFLVECAVGATVVTFTDDKDSLSFQVNPNDQIDFIILKNGRDSAYTRISGLSPNAHFTDQFIREHQGKTIVEIPEVSELVNIIMALHRDAEIEDNMFATWTDYYKEIRTYFKPYLNHPIMDTIHSYISGLHRLDEQEIDIFSQESYWYYYALKMNACAYSFDNDGHIVNDGMIDNVAIGWFPLDPMKDINLMEDFARKSDFRKFYHAHLNYYEEIKNTYRSLNPIQQMQGWLDDKFGSQHGCYAVYFSPLIYGAHSTQHFEQGDFKFNMMFISQAEIDTSYSIVQNTLHESRVVFTEIDHNYVNPMSSHFYDRIDKAFHKRELWAKGDVTSAYNDPFAVFNEYMTWAVYTLYVNDHYPNAELEEFLNTMETQMVNNRGFIRFKEFNREMLRKYKSNPEISMMDLFDYMLNWTKKVSKKKC